MGKDKNRDRDDAPKQGPKIKITSRDPKRLVRESDEAPADNRPSGGNQRGAGTDESAGASSAAPSGAAPAPDQSAEVAELKEQLLRVHADFDNFKRRTAEERAELFDTARAEMALKLMPVIDNFDRAAEHVPENIKKDPWYAGVEGIRKQFNDLLAELGIERIKSVGEPFDPERHEAISHEPSDEYDKDVVSEEFEAGYALDDSVIRPSKVNVSSGAAGDQSNRKENK